MDEAGQHWQLLQQWLARLLDLPPHESPSLFLDRELATQPSLYREVKQMWELMQNEDSLLEKPAIYADGIPFPRVGDRFGDFKLEKELGRGSFGLVFLAEQISLNRKVALKITPNLGEEGRTMAPLEHEHIVRIFSEGVEPNTQLRYLCMQWIQGPSLDQILEGEVTSPKIELDFLTWGEKLALALEKAHQEGVLHLDVKPANILLSQTGRPYLTDFNVAIDSHRKSRNLMGGTFRYMAPEHQQYLKDNTVSIDGRADIYSLGKVLSELYHPSEGVFLKAFDEELLRYLNKMIEPFPENRPSTALEVAQFLNANLKKRKVVQLLPPLSGVYRLGQRYPFTYLFLMLLISNIIVSIINISHNAVRIVGDLTPVQRSLFSKLVMIYNPIAYFICLITMLALLLPVLKNRNRFYRKRLLSVGAYLTLIPVLGWMPGAIFFPGMMDLLSGPISLSTYIHFFISITLCCAIAITYSYYFFQSFVLRALYPFYWIDEIEMPSFLAQETSTLLRFTRYSLWGVALLPPVTTLIVSLVGFNLTQPTSGQQLRILVGSLACLGILGLLTALKGKETHTRLVQIYEG